MKRKYFLNSIATCIFTVFVAQSHISLGATDPQQLLNELQAGGHVIYFRHGEKSKDPNIPSRLPEEFDSCLFPNVLLTEVGVTSMQFLGQQFKQLNIPVGRVVSSPVCRCIESAWYSFKDVTVDSSLNGVYERDSNGKFIINESVTEAYAVNLRRILTDSPNQGSNTVLFAHSSNILALTGLKLNQGEAAVFKPDGQGHFVLISRVKLEEWQRLAQ